MEDHEICTAISLLPAGGPQGSTVALIFYLIFSAFLYILPSVTDYFQVYSLLAFELL